MIKKIGILAVITILAAAFYISYNKKEKVELPSYSGYKVKVSDLDNYIEASGIVEAKSTKSIYVDKPLKVKNLYFQEGDYIKKGDLIMTFDDEERNAILRNIEKQELKIKKLERDCKNAEELYELGGSTKVEIEDLKYDIRVEGLALEEYREELSKTVEEIRSPFEGTIISMTAEENYRVNTQEELLEIADLSDIKITAQVAEYDINNVKTGQEVRVKPEMFEKKKTLKGRVAAIANISTDSTSDSEAYVEVTIELEGNDNNFLPGFTTDVEIVYQSKKDTIFVPRSALVSQGDMIYVYRVNDENRVSKRTVETGITNKENIEILSGLRDGEKILLNVDKGLEEGAKVNLTPAKVKSGNGRRNRRS